MARRRLRDFRLQKADIHNMDDRVLLINLYVTQAAVALLAVALLWWQKASFRQLFAPLEGVGLTIVTYGILYAALVLAVDGLLERFVPEEVADDGGINEKIFKNRSLWHLAVICLVVAVCEELLFRGAIQSAIGNYWTSVLFAVIHVRYLRHWLMTLLVFCISYGLGWIYVQTGTLITPIIAHFLIDVVLGYHLRGGNKR